ncbi:MAG: DUF917 family protein [Armatimonadota bacterium]|nr:DUF917 family protein [Armatimonadota bacterium]MDR7434581.1 DUF917 family protein [Armatimonadota bacterium]
MDHIEPLVVGGSLLGGGGGGDPQDGRQLARKALELGDPYLVPIETLRPDAVVVTVALVGAPSAPERSLNLEDLPKAVELIQETFGAQVQAIMTNENGGFASVNGWIQSAVLGLPIVDAPCNGRAHPTALMGAMGLHLVPGYRSLQVALGGTGTRRVEVCVSGSLEGASAIVRQAAVQAGGLVAVARNPVTANYVAQHGAPGALTMALRIGEAVLRTLPHRQATWEAAAEAVGGRIVDVGRVLRVHMETVGGFDRGAIFVEGGRIYELTVWNEYMTLEVEGQRLATFPDLIATLGENGLPLTSAEIREGVTVALLAAPKENLILGAGMRDPQLFRIVEQNIGKELIRYIFGEVEKNGNETDNRSL